MKVQVQRISKDAKPLVFAHGGDSGVDLYAVEDMVIAPGERKLVKTGLKIAVPKGFEAQVRPKSGLALNSGITVLNTPGTIDSGYRGEVCVIVINHGSSPYKVEKGKKIAQIVFAKIEMPEFEETDGLDETERNSGGFGSTGTG